MTRQEKAVKYFRDGFHCSQAVLVSYAEECGLTEEQALKLGSCFGGGMRRGEVCGACTGALMVLGLKYASGDPDDPEAPAAPNEQAVRFLDEFKKRRGSCLCRELLGCDPNTDEGYAIVEEKALFETVCPQLVQTAGEILQEMLGLDKYPADAIS